MRQTTNGEKVEYLLRIKFPGGLHPQPLRSSGNSGGPSDAEMRRIQAERERLSALPGIELSRLCAIELDAKCEREEKALFFNQPAANADFGYWSTVEYWTLDETIALLLGKNPEVVKWQTVEPYLGHADLARYERQCLGIGTSAANAEPGFAKQYALLRRRAMRADVLNPVNARVDPVGAVEWARQTGGISLPAPLEAGLAGRRPRPAQAMVTAPERASAVTLEPQAAPVANESASNGMEPAKAGPVSEKPWLLIDPSDPKAIQPWYTPARYFARQLVIEDSTLLQKRSVLADKVSKSLADTGFKKRGGKLALKSDTVLKAFSNVCLG